MIVEVYQDTVCPWCRIGKRNLRLALERWPGEPVQVVYRSFILNPNIPPAGYDFRSYMAQKGGGRIPVEQFFIMPRERGRQVDLEFNFETIQRAPNSELSHWLVKLVPEENQEAVLDAIYTAYFENGQDIGDLNTLLAIAEGEGLKTNALREALESGAAHLEVQEEARQAQRLGISGVPFFIVDRRLAFSGAQPPEVILSVLQQAAQVQSAH